MRAHARPRSHDDVWVVRKLTGHSQSLTRLTHASNAGVGPIGSSSAPSSHRFGPAVADRAPRDESPNSSASSANLEIAGRIVS